VVAVGLSGCGSSGSDPAAPPPSSSTSPVSTTADAEAVARQYFDLLNHPVSVELARSFEQIMSPDCDCRQIVEDTRRDAKAGHVYFGDTTLNSLQSTAKGTDRVVVVSDFSYSRSGFKSASGKVLSSSPGRNNAGLELHMVLVDGQWMIDKLVYVRSGTRQ
jgi:hypothetical protein